MLPKHAIKGPSSKNFKFEMSQKRGDGLRPVICDLRISILTYNFDYAIVVLRSYNTTFVSQRDRLLMNCSPKMAEVFVLIWALQAAPSLNSIQDAIQKAK